MNINKVTNTYVSSLRVDDIFTISRGNTRYVVVSVTTRGGQTSVAYQIADNPWSVWNYNVPSLTMVQVHDG